MHAFLNVPLPLLCTARSIPFIRVIRGLEGSQWGGSTVGATLTIQLAASIFAPPPHDLLSADDQPEESDGILGLCRSVNNKLIGWEVNGMDGRSFFFFSSRSEIGFWRNCWRKSARVQFQNTERHIQITPIFSPNAPIVFLMTIIIYLAAAALLL